MKSSHSHCKKRVVIHIAKKCIKFYCTAESFTTQQRVLLAESFIAQQEALLHSRKVSHVAEIGEKFLLWQK